MVNRDITTPAQREQLARRRAAMNEPPVDPLTLPYWRHLADPVAPAEPQQITQEQAAALSDQEFALVRQHELNLAQSSFGEVKPDLNALRAYAAQVTAPQAAPAGSMEEYAAERQSAGVKATGIFGQYSPGERSQRTHRSSWR